ncbi:SseB family protein [Streptomyces sp. NPDC023723]|uniref:SseB family protein n=1 Tax=Streptomyces sp. NPDC023723 TaxID=3154323 RepID=UPI0033F071C9
MGTDASLLRLRLADLAATGEGDPRSLVGEFRRSEVLVPVADGSVLAAEAGGVRWLFAFTDAAALRRFARARGATGLEEVPVHGARLLDQVVPAVAEAGGPVGIAVDAGSPAGMVLPPVRGVVPAAAALDTDSPADTAPPPPRGIVAPPTAPLNTDNPARTAPPPPRGIVAPPTAPLNTDNPADTAPPPPRGIVAPPTAPLNTDGPDT